MPITLTEDKIFQDQDVIDLYNALNWSSAKKPDQLVGALRNSQALIQAYDGDRLVGLGNAISDGHLVVYYPHLCVHPDYHGHGIGKMIMDRFDEIYGHFHQQILVADGASVGFYKKCGFVKAGDTQAVWKYQGDEH